MRRHWFFKSLASLFWPGTDFVDSPPTTEISGGSTSLVFDPRPIHIVALQKAFQIPSFIPKS